MIDVRPEAGVVSWSDLTDEQKQAGRQAHALLIQMASSTETVDKPKPAFLPRLDRARGSRVLLIDGGRGSGKTALLLSILAFWRRPFEDGVASKDDTAPDLPADVNANDFRGRIVPIGLLDLHPIAPSTNLLFHVVGRFARVVEWMEGDNIDGQPKEPPPWHLGVEAEIKSRKKWQSLLRAVAAAWDGNADQRRGRMDLDALAADVEEAERQRLDLVSAFTEFIHQLVADFCKHRRLDPTSSPPLFVLAIDDADMNPRRSVELLDMMRMLWHPRVAFVLTGDSDLFEHTLAEHFLGELRKPLREHGLVASEIVSLADRRPHLSLAAEAYDKIIPAGHRCAVVPIPAARRLIHDKTKLAAALAAIPAEASGGPELAAYFSKVPQLSEALPDRLRGLIDLADFAHIQRDSGASHDCERASRVVAAIWRHAVRSAPERIEGFDEEMVRVDERTGAIDIQIGRHPPGIGARDLSLVAQIAADAGHPVVHLSRVDQFEAPFEAGRPLPRPLVAALMLAANVAADQTEGGWDLTSTTQGGYEGIFAEAFFQVAGSSTPLRFAWPLPPGFSLPFYAAFSSRWTAKLQSKKKKDLDELARHFLFLVVYLWSGSRTLVIEPKAPDWPTITELVGNLFTHGANAWRTWAFQRAGLLAAPEYGLPAKSANEWLFALRILVGEARWKTMAEALRVERRKRMEVTGEGLVERTIAEIDEALTGYDWYTEVEGLSHPVRVSPF